MTGSSIASRNAARMGHRLPQRRLLPPPGRRARGRRSAAGVRDPDDVLVPQRLAPPAAARLICGAFHHAYGAERFDTELPGRGLLTRAQLLDGAAQLLGDWFPDAYADDTRRAWGIAFPSAEERAAYEPERRMALARLGKLTPGSAPPEQQTWHTYPPVEMPSVEGVIAALTRPETWPDYASELGRFTPLRAGGLAGQTFEIEVAAGTESAPPVFTRGYVTITRLVTPDDPDALRAYFAELEEGLARYGEDEPRRGSRRRRAGRRVRPDHPRGTFHGLRPQPADPVHA